MVRQVVYMVTTGLKSVPLNLMNSTLCRSLFYALKRNTACTRFAGEAEAETEAVGDWNDMKKDNFQVELPKA
jgi:hypothetical protein